MKIHLYLKDLKPTLPASGGMEKAVTGLAAGIVAGSAALIALWRLRRTRHR